MSRSEVIASMEAQVSASELNDINQAISGLALAEGCESQGANVNELVLDWTTPFVPTEPKQTSQQQLVK